MIKDIEIGEPIIYTCNQEKVTYCPQMTKAGMLREFHNAFGTKRLEGGTKEEMKALISFRLKLIQEEFDEYVEAGEQMDFVELTDALGDMLYLIYGDADIWDIDIDEAFSRIHESNMSKLEDGKAVINDGIRDPKRPIGKILKGKDFFTPDLKDLVEHIKPTG